MKPAPFAYAAPDTIEECLQLLATYGEDAKVIAGGQSLVPLLNLRMARPSVLIDVGRLPGLDRWHMADDRIRFGALVRQRSLEREPELRSHLPLLAEAVRLIGHPATRSRGTIVGSMCHADPAAELPVCATLLGADFTLRSQSGDRVVSATNFFVDALTTSAREDELVENVVMPARALGMGYSFLEVARRHGDFALVSVASAVSRDDCGRYDETAVAIGGVAPRAQRFRLGDFEAGAEFSPTKVGEFASEIATRIEPDSDLHASAAYRRSVAAHLVRKGLCLAASRAQIGA